MSGTVFITGASSGIGKATARHFQALGWNVVASMRRPENEQELTALPNVLVVRLDVEDHPSIAAATRAALERFGQVDVLVNNAGYGSYGLLEATPVEKIRRQFEVNVIGLLATTQALLPHFRARRQGVVVNISSVGGRVTFPLGTLYHGSKFAVEGLSEALSFELALVGVRVKLVEPGLVRTDFRGRSFDFNNDTTLVEYQEAVGRMLAAKGSVGAGGCEPEVVAEVIYRAATDGSERLRYGAGPDAEPILAHRRRADDAEFMASIRAQFGLA